MNTRNIFYLFCTAAISLTAAACSDKDDTTLESGLPPVLEAVSPTLGAASHSRAVNADDPSFTACHERHISGGHQLSVTIGNDAANKAAYSYNASLQTWRPITNGVRFPDFGTHQVQLRLCAQLADPIAAQTTGTATQLLDADVLVHTIAAQAPVKELPAATLTHAHSLIELDLDSSLDPAKITDITVNGTLIPYNVPNGADKSLTYLVIVSPGDTKAELSITYNGIGYTSEIVPKNGNTPKPFAANTRYIVPLEINAGKLVCGDMLVNPWSEAGGASIPVGVTSFRIEGFGGRTLDVKLQGIATLFTGALTLDAQGEGTLDYIALDNYRVDVEYVQYLSETIAVGKPLGSEVVILKDPLTGQLTTQP